MPSNRRTSNECFQPEPARNMGSLEARNALKKQQNSKRVKEPVQLSQGNRRNLQNRVSQRTAKSSGDCQEHCVKRTATKDDELVKHMSKLPGYLQHVEKQENIQEKALNVGVLDWGNLQKWKHNHKGSPLRGGNNVSPKSNSLSLKTTTKSFSLPSTVPGGALANKRRQLELTKKELLDSETDNKSSSSLSRKSGAKSGALPRTFPGYGLSDKSKQPKVREKQLQDSAIDLGHGLSATSKQLEEKKKELQDLENDDPHHLPGELKSIVLLLPKRSDQDSPLVEPPESPDENLMEAKSPDDFTQKSEKPHPEIPSFCELPSRVEWGPAPDMRAEGLELSFFNSQNKGNKLSPSDCAEQNEVESENANNETLKMLDQEMAELATRKGSNQSPHGRFSFSLSRMSRSFSFKEGPVVQQLSSRNVSVRSGPLRANASGCLDDSIREKLKAQNRTRSSPLRRMLDPLLKPKSLNPLGFAEILHPLKGSLNSNDFTPMIAVGSFKKEKPDPSTTQALMQLTLKDGFPMFKFVVNDSSKILAATTKFSPSSGGDDMGQNYTFYSVNEVKRKIGSWISQGSKEKSCSYAYDTIGQMTISNSHISDVKDSNTQYLIRESVLFGVECRRANQASQVYTHNIELAAVVVKMPREELSHGVQQSCKDTNKRVLTESLPEDGCFFNFDEKEGTNNIVILPGGIHSLPKKGAPSSLIHRWRSGGSCDCGGWDVGCKLRILSNQNGSCKNQMTCQASPSSDHVELFAQGDTQRSRPIFSLAPHKHGLYTIEFDSSISALQAFFISLSVICCQKSSNLFEVSSLSKEKVFEESELKRSDGVESKPILGKMPAKYTPNPPLSPFGRA
ncbi:hypothetical protein SLE2022_074740 [Rubroshorea leprosula]